MNERMYELINQCFIGTTDGKLSDLNTVSNIEKFAELIVRECAKLADSCPGEYLEDAGKYPSTWIKEHFEVE